MRRLVVVAALALAAACGGDATGPDGGATIAGRYTLQSVDGDLPPIEYVNDDTLEVHLVSAVVTLHADGTFGDTTTFSVTRGGETTTEIDGYRGTYQRSGAAVTFVTNDSQAYAMTYDGEDRLTQNIQGTIFIFRRD